MKLHAMNRVLLVHQAHDLPLFRPRGDFQTIRQGLAFDDERMITRRFKRIGHAGKNALAFVMNRRGLAVHETIGANDIATVNLPD